MSDDSKGIPPEQLPSDDLHPPPMPVINLGHLILEPETRSGVVEDIAKACHDLGYFQVCSPRTFLVFFLLPCHFSHCPNSHS
jgi:hypothetical protein